MSLDQILMLPPGYGFDASNAAPTITVPGAQSAVSNVQLNITGTSISDAELSQTQTITLTVSHGTLTIPNTTGLTWTVGDGVADATMTFYGSQFNCNVGLSSILYTSTADYVGADSLVISTNDGAGGTDSDSIAITVASPILGLFTYYWKLDEASGVAASSANSANLTATNSPLGVAGKLNNGREFVAASSQYLSAVANYGMNYQTDWTIALWVYPYSLKSHPATQSILTKTVSGGYPFFRLYEQNGGLTFALWGDASPGTGVCMSANTWSHIVLTHTASDRKTRIFIDGSLNATSTAISTNFTDASGNSLTIGATDFNGIIDEFGISVGTAFDADMASAHMDATNAGRGYPNF